eukprot:jgi/Mesvir1/3753/Mv15027-RA.2
MASLQVISGLTCRHAESLSKPLLGSISSCPAFLHARRHTTIRNKAVIGKTQCRASNDVQTPHSGYHYDGSARRFFEGWYFKVTIPEENQSFAFMYSIEDPPAAPTAGLLPELPNPLSALLLPPGGNSTVRWPGVGAQIMGPDDQYLCQYSTDTSSFFADPKDLELAHTFAPKRSSSTTSFSNSGKAKRSWDRNCQGFEATSTRHQGSLVDDGRSASRFRPIAKSASWDYVTTPVVGWGDVDKPQLSTAGWMAALPVFEPHWQVLMSLGRSTGYIDWDGVRYEFKDAPSYAEKNWGGSFPLKWFWCQCNAFRGLPTTCLTSGGGRRLLPLVAGESEDVAMVGIHHEGKFYEFVPWKGTVQWVIEPWGSWQMNATNEEYEVQLVATCKESDGVTLRAPTNEKGLTDFCRDTFFGHVELSLWRLRGGQRVQVILAKL